MDLFVTPEEYVGLEKTAAEVALPEDPNGWPNEILQELYKQIPYISDFDPNIVMDRVDAERGYGFGHVEVMNKTEIQRGASPEGLQAAGVRQVRIPVIIQNRKLQPFDVLITEDSKMFPLTESRIRSAIFRPQAFDITGRTPGDMSMIGQLYPPYRQNYGFGGGGASMSVGMGKDGSAKTKEGMSKLLGELVKKAPTDRMARISQLATSRGSQMVQEGGEAAAKGRKYLTAGNYAAQKIGSILETILPSINESDYNNVFSQLENQALQAAYIKNAHATSAALMTLSKFEPGQTKKLASVLVEHIKPTVMQLVKGSDGYILKTASHKCWAPFYQNIDRGEAVRRMGEKIVLAADMNGAVTVTEGAVDAVSPEEDRPELIKDFGLYKVQTEDGKELVGWVFPNLLDLDGAALPLALFTNGSQAATQGEIVGVKSGEGTSLPAGTPPSGKGCFYRVLPNGKAEATVPMDIQGTASAEEEAAEGEGASPAILATTFDGRQVEVHTDQPNLVTLTEGPNGDVMLPADFKWLDLGSADEVVLVGDPSSSGKQASAVRGVTTVEVRSGGADCFSVGGYPVEKIADDRKQFLSIDDTMFLLGGLGVDPAYSCQKLAEAYTFNRTVEIPIGRPIKTAADMNKEASAGAAALLEHIPALRVNLVKEAALIPDPQAVDTVLSLGFVNPENVTTFISYLPKIDEAQSHMCELLVAARLGLKEVPTGPLEKAIKSVEGVVEGLKVLAFQKPE
jgi:hypothetical protein